jgi:hypothetical protein
LALQPGASAYVALSERVAIAACCCVVWEVEMARVVGWFQILVGVSILALWTMLRAGLLSGIAFGALVYSVVNSSGYHAESAEWRWIGVFAVLLAVTVGLFGGWWGLFKGRGGSARAQNPDRNRVPLAGG